MLLVAMSNNLGILWIAVELTTLASVFLVTFHDRDTSLEAAWKFLMLGSLGLGFRAAGHGAVVRRRPGPARGGAPALHWTRLMSLGHELHPFTLRLGVVFALIGYGTKAGLAPMHTWKPDAYREAPSPAGRSWRWHGQRRALLHPPHPPDFEGGPGPGFSGTCCWCSAFSPCSSRCRSS